MALTHLIQDPNATAEQILAVARNAQEIADAITLVLAQGESAAESAKKAIDASIAAWAALKVDGSDRAFRRFLKLLQADRQAVAACEAVHAASKRLIAWKDALRRGDERGDEIGLHRAT